MFGFGTDQLISGLVNRTKHQCDFVRVTLDEGAYVVEHRGDDGWIRLMRVDEDGVVRAIEASGKLPHAYLALLNDYLIAVSDR